MKLQKILTYTIGIIEAENYGPIELAEVPVGFDIVLYSLKELVLHCISSEYVKSVYSYLAIREFRVFKSQLQTKLFIEVQERQKKIKMIDKFIDEIKTNDNSAQLVKSLLLAEIDGEKMNIRYLIDFRR